MVMSSLDQIQNIFAYAFGFSIGILVGMKIEEKLVLALKSALPFDYHRDHVLHSV
jgi:uncharacterized protein YebE (UPF0316 family)